MTVPEPWLGSPTVHVCLHCSGPTHRYNSYCQDACRSAARNLRESKVCPWCGIVTVGTPGHSCQSCRGIYDYKSGIAAPNDMEHGLGAGVWVCGTDGIRRWRGVAERLRAS